MNAELANEKNDDSSLKNSYKRRRSLFTVLTNNIPAYGSKDILRIRKKLQLTQPEFAMVVGVPYHTLRRWENGTVPTPHSIQHLLYLIDKDETIIHEFVTITKNDQQTSLLGE